MSETRNANHQPGYQVLRVCWAHGPRVRERSAP
jgi:hypothetical protein